ncbi:MAG: uroporphyrinogen decarboxylase [Oscillospiraceae bacterium]|nr:uroporphyrinogen decarboxylase [Oscillospiraceae bacterium]
MQEMTSRERVEAVLRGETPDRLPVIPQSFLFSVRHSGFHIGQVNRDPAKMAQCHIACQDHFGYDGCVVDVDDASLAEACGAKVTYREGDVAAVDENSPILEDLRDIDSLHMPDPEKDARLPVWLETTERLLSAVGDHVFIMGRADQGPFDLLCLLRGAQNLMMDLIEEDEDVVHHALAWCTEAHTRFARAMLKLGAHATSMGDAYASPNLISPAMYREFAAPYEKKVAEAVRDLPGAYSIHICGNTNAIIEDMGRLGSDILEVDWQVDMGRARAAVPESVVLMGNLNPSDPMCTGAPETVLSQARALVGATKGRGLILSSGCALGENTKPENVAALVESAKRFGTREQLLELRR